MIMRIFKAAGAVMLGFVSVFILSVVTDIVLESVSFFPAQDHPESYTWWMLLIALMYRSVYAVIGGFLTAALSSDKPMRNTVILGCIGLVLSVIGLFMNADKTGPSGLWYPIALAVLSFPCVWLGGKVRTVTRA